MADFRLCSTCRSYSQASLYHYALKLISDQSELTFAHFRYFLGSFRPRKTTHYAGSWLFTQLETGHRKGGISRTIIDIIIYHLCYTVFDLFQCIAIVKVHRVLPSIFEYSASSRRIQFHGVHVGDSGAVVTPFMQVTN